MSVLILFRSVTFAQRGKRILERGGIRAELSRAPMGHTERGCGYALRIPEREKSRALELLRCEGIDHGRILVRNDSGTWEEAEL